MQQSLELNEIQGIILSGYGHLKYSSHIFLQIQDAVAAKTWLGQLMPAICTAAPWPKDANGNIIKPGTCLNLAISRTGLEKLNISLAGFTTEFCEGIAGPIDNQDKAKVVNRSRRLGDTGDSAPANWDFGGPNNEVIDVLLILFALDSAGLSNLRSQQTALFEQHGLKLVAAQEAYRPDHGREPFGFMDGFSQPGVEGSVTGDTTPDEQPVIKAGEFILGYQNEYKLLPPTPTRPELARNGSYLVYRKLEQDVAGFWNFIYAAAHNDPEKAEKLAAKLVGRWRSGAPLTLAPDQDDPGLAQDQDKSNDFNFANADPYGYGCPIGSHIRRVNPRDSLPPDPHASIVDVKRHRIIRRGRVYGAEYPQDVLAYLTQQAQAQGSQSFVPDGDNKRGLAQILINADIKRQFEFIQQTWVNDPKFDGLYDSRDPLIGNNAENPKKTYTMTIERSPVRQQVLNLPRFVTVKGGGYFFLPGISGLKFIAGS